MAIAGRNNAASWRERKPTTYIQLCRLSIKTFLKDIAFLLQNFNSPISSPILVTYRNCLPTRILTDYAWIAARLLANLCASMKMCCLDQPGTEKVSTNLTTSIPVTARLLW